MGGRFDNFQAFIAGRLPVPLDEVNLGHRTGGRPAGSASVFDGRNGGRHRVLRDLKIGEDFLADAFLVRAPQAGDFGDGQRVPVIRYVPPQIGEVIVREGPQKERLPRQFRAHLLNNAVVAFQGIE